MSVTLQRETSQAQLYLVVGGWKLAISSADITPLGLDLSKVQVVPDGTLAPYAAAPLGPPVGVPKASDAHLHTPSDAHNNYTDTRGVVRRDILVAGWLAKTPWANTVVANPWGYIGIEDYHYDPILDVDFLLQMYGPGGLSTALRQAQLPSHLSEDTNPYPGPPLAFGDVDPATGAGRGVTLNSFALPHMGGGLMAHDPFQAEASASVGSPLGPMGTDPLGEELLGCSEAHYDFLLTGPVFCHGELNTWHINDVGAPVIAGVYTGPRFDGRGAPPAGWVIDASDANGAHPFPPLNPDGGPRTLQAGDYVVMRGTLWQEHAHDQHKSDSDDPNSRWRTVPGLLGHGGLLELHPVDWIQRVTPPPRPTTAYMVACCGLDTTQTAYALRHFDVSFFPYPKLAPSSQAQLQVSELIDGRYSDLSTLDTSDNVPRVRILDNARVAVHLNLLTTQNKQGHFKAVYTTWWVTPGSLLASVLAPAQATIGVPTPLRVHAQDGL